MNEGVVLLLLLLLALALHAAVSLMNAALQKMSAATMRERADDGDATARRFLALTENSLNLSMTVSITHILTRIAIAVLLALLLLEPLANGDAGARLLLAGATVIIGAGLTLIIGDLVPEALGSAHAGSIFAHSITPMRLLIVFISPATALVLLLSRLISQLLGGDALMMVNLVTEEEIMSLVHASHSGGVIEEEEKDMIASVLQLDESSARELMTPRIDIVALEAAATVSDALSAFVASGFSRIPVYEESIDNVQGLLYAKDILTAVKDGQDFASQRIGALVRDAYFVPETKPADALLKELQEKNVHLAVVVDEYGGTSGLVTIEDLIEEIVGDIRDEHDFGEEEDYVEVGDGSYLIEASMDLDDLNALLACSIDTSDADTLGGYIYLALGRVPRTDETIETDILRMTVQSIDGHRIRKVKVRKINGESADAILPHPPAPSPTH
ncbi:MAG: hemolysin family protein [Chloroflexota bacterium]|nr:hemolysin family protein [Chloroflexota bacterium]MDE2948408.1 hemolysin family protein [Chloroflexota bacterium]